VRLAILGRSHWLVDAARALVANGHSITIVATAHASLEYRANEADFAGLAREYGAHFMLAPDINGEEFRNAVTTADAELGISINWPTLVGRATCAKFPLGILNGHAGDLPRYRGNACPNWAILSGESHVGLCVHAMDPDAVDAGPIYARHFVPIHQGTYIADVYEAMDAALPALFVRAVACASDRNFAPEDQRLSSAKPLRCYPRRPDDGLIDWCADAEQVARLVRASSRPFAGAFAFLEGAIRVTIWRAAPIDLDYEIRAVPGQILGRSASRGVLVACGHGVLEIEEAETSNGHAMSATNRFRLTGRMKVQ
jgi:methionyl-tRNA formyltransferase